MAFVNTGGVLSGGGVSTFAFGAAADVAHLQKHTSGYINVTEAPYNAVGDGVADDTAAIQAAIDAATAGRAVFLPAGTYKTTSALVLKPNLHLVGPNRPSVDNWPTGAVIQNAASNVFAATADDNLGGLLFENFSVIANTGAGHIFDLSSAKIASQCEWRNVYLIQQNAAKAVIYAVMTRTGGGFFQNWFHHLDYKYKATNSVPAINIVVSGANSTVNNVVIEDFRSTSDADTSTGTYSIWIEQQGGIGTAAMVRRGLFEWPGGGMVNLLSMARSGIELAQSFDATVTPANPVINIGKSAAGGSAASYGDWVIGSLSVLGTAGVPDLKIDLSVGGQSGFFVGDSKFNYVDGVSTANGPGVSFRNCSIANFENIAYTTLTGSAGLDLEFKSTAGTSKNYTIWNGYPGNFDGALHIYQNGVRLGAISSAGNFGWGGTLASPNAYIAQDGGTGLAFLNIKGAFYPATTAGAFQSAADIRMGAAAPTSGTWGLGSIVFNSSPSVGQPKGWVCTVAGTPGTWVSMGNL